MMVYLKAFVVMMEDFAILMACFAILMLIGNVVNEIEEKKNDNPRSWEEFCEKYPNSKGEYFIGGESSEIIEIKHQLIRSSVWDKTLIKTKEEAEAFLALMQLRQLRKAWVGVWEPNWRENDIKGVIDSHNGGIRFICYTHTNRPLSFPTENMVHEFLKCFRDLLEKAKPLL